MFEVARENVDEHLPKAVRSLYIYHCRYCKLLPRVLELGLVNEGEEGEKRVMKEVFKLTAQQLVRMHKGEVKSSKYDNKEENEKRQSVGAHQEMWSFDAFFRA